MADGLKVFFEFDSDFFPDMPLLATAWDVLYGSESPIYYDALFRKGIADRNVLGRFDVSEGAGPLCELSETELVSTLLSELDTIYGGKASNHYIKHMALRWSNRPYLGSYSYEIDDYEKTATSLMEPFGNSKHPHSQIWYAGEATAEYQATVHGAAREGRRVIQDLLMSMNTARTHRNYTRRMVLSSH